MSAQQTGTGSLSQPIQPSPMPKYDMLNSYQFQQLVLERLERQSEYNIGLVGLIEGSDDRLQHIEAMLANLALQMVDLIDFIRPDRPPEWHEEDPKP